MNQRERNISIADDVLNHNASIAATARKYAVSPSTVRRALDKATKNKGQTKDMKELREFVSQNNRWAELSNTNTIDMPPSYQDCESLFANVACKLSPENLHCDGEISNAEANKKAVYLNKVWDQLESVYGRRVGEHEAFNWD